MPDHMYLEIALWPVPNFNVNRFRRFLLSDASSSLVRLGNTEFGSGYLTIIDYAA